MERAVAGLWTQQWHVPLFWQKAQHKAVWVTTHQISKYKLGQIKVYSDLTSIQCFRGFHHFFHRPIKLDLWIKVVPSSLHLWDVVGIVWLYYPLQLIQDLKDIKKQVSIISIAGPTFLWLMSLQIRPNGDNRMPLLSLYKCTLRLKATPFPVPTYT